MVFYSRLKGILELLQVYVGERRITHNSFLWPSGKIPILQDQDRTYQTHELVNSLLHGVPKTALAGPVFIKTHTGITDWIIQSQLFYLYCNYSYQSLPLLKRERQRSLAPRELKNGLHGIAVKP